MRRFVFTLALVMAATVLSTGTAAAAAPLADSLSTPSILTPGTLNGSSASSNTQATFVSEPTPSCQHNVGHTIWWRYRPPALMVISLDTNGSNFDTVLAVYRSTANGLVEVACNDDNNGATSKLRFRGAEGTSYYVQVGGYSTNSGTIQFGYSFVVANDMFAGAKVISPGFSAVFSNATATTQPGEPSGCSSPGRTVWYKVTVSSKQRLTFDSFGSSFDSQVAVWQGTSLAGLAYVGCGDDTDETNGDGAVTWTARPNRTYYIQVSAFQGALGTLDVNLVRAP